MADSLPPLISYIHAIIYVTSSVINIFYFYFQSTMVLGMLALMIHLWVCSMRFFQYYLDTLIRDVSTTYLYRQHDRCSLPLSTLCFPISYNTLVSK